MTRACAVVCLAAVLLAGCPKSREGDGGGDIAVETLPRELAAAYCDLIFRCELSGEDSAALELLFEDRSACTSYLESAVFSTGKIDALERAVSEGTVVYDAAAARTCVASVGADCSATVSGADIGDADACDAVFTGTVAEGGTCWIDEECAGDLGCDTDAGCPGTCTAGGGFTCGGEVCSADQECYYPEGGPERCVTEVIQADGAEGEPCGLVSETATEITRRACREGLWCSGDSYTMGTCRTPIPADGSCSMGDVCVDGHVCAGGTCRAVTIVRTAGAPCDETALEICDPFARLECTGGSCVEFTDGADGSPCRSGDFGELSCNAGLVCHGDTDTCGPPRSAGETCSANRDCASGSCDYVAETCRERYCDG